MPSERKEKNLRGGGEIHSHVQDPGIWTMQGHAG